MGGAKVGVYPAIPEGELLENEPRLIPIIYGDILATNTQYTYPLPSAAPPELTGTGLGRGSTSVVLIRDGTLGHCDFLIDSGRPMDRNAVIGGPAISHS